MPERNSSPASSRLLLFILTLGVFAVINTEMGVVGIVPQIAHEFGVSVPEAGWTVSVFALIVALSAPVLPLLCSRFNRKLMLVLALSLFLASNLVSFAAMHFWQVLLARAVPALMQPVLVSLAFTLAAASVPAERSSEAVSKVFVGVTAGMVLGVPVTSFIAVNLSYQAAMLFFAAVSLLALLGVIFCVPSMPGRKQTLGQQLQVLRRAHLWHALLALTLLNGAVFGFFSFMSDFLHRVSGLEFNTIAVALLVYSLCNIAGNLISGKMLTHYRTVCIALLPVLLLVLYVLLYVLGFSAYSAVALLSVIGMAGGAVGVVGQNMLSKAAGEAQEFANGLFLSAANAGTMAGTALCGLFIALGGTHSALWGSFLFLIAGYVFVLAYLRAEKKASGRHAVPEAAC